MRDDDFVPTSLMDLPMARDALGFARELHHGQRRSSDHAPFILHPLEVAALLYTTGYGELEVTAGILHDAVEDTDADVETIAERFGTDVAKLRELRAQAGSHPGLLSSREVEPKLAHYEQSLDMLEQATAEHPLVQKLRFELEALRALPPRSG